MILQTRFFVVIERENEYDAVLDLLRVHAYPNQACDARVAQVVLGNIAPAEKVHLGTCSVDAPAMFQNIQNVTFRNVALRATLLSMMCETHIGVYDVRLLCSIDCRDGMNLLRCAVYSSHCRKSGGPHKPNQWKLRELFVKIVMVRGRRRAIAGVLTRKTTRRGRVGRTCCVAEE